MKRGLSFGFLVSIILLSACGQQGEILEQEGIIVEIKDNQDKWNQILVVSNINEGDIVNKTTDELIEMAQGKDGAYYSLEPSMYEKLEVGTHVIVYWNRNQELSEPPQREAEKIDVVSK
ncbi:DUF3221 domain-containing protein [Halalkalibacter sp. AB-rgal2]|uniref:DUF3221 domain-containing protein n=1 Tax=Halalkalibacter sp. AB-rgal2 TaxID=3242695 RepID=UPI00359EF3F4